jgi:hypothetical protein
MLLESATWSGGRINQERALDEMEGDPRKSQLLLAQSENLLVKYYCYNAAVRESMLDMIMSF